MIGNNGYSVLKENLTSSQISNIRKDLTVKAFVNTSYSADSVPFSIYSESKRKYRCSP